MTIGWIRTVASIGLCVLLAACSHQQETIYTVQNKPLPAAARGLSPDQIESRIDQAMVAKAWKVDKAGPGELRGTIEWGGRHSAIVAVLITGQAYSIRLQSSTNLRESGGYIHRQYNVRVRALEEEIDRRLKGAST